MYLSVLVFPLLLPTAQTACINCGGRDKTSSKRIKMPNKSVFTRLAGIELLDVMETTVQINHEVCAQLCDAHTDCAVFEFNLPNKLCIMASEYARLTDDLSKDAFKTLVFVKVRGKFTKALPKEKETCLDKSEYEDYVKNEVDKWLNPSPKKSTSASAPDGEKTPLADTTTEEEGSSATDGNNNLPSTSTTSARVAATTTTAATPSTTVHQIEEEPKESGAGATDISAPVTALTSTASPRITWNPSTNTYAGSTSSSMPATIGTTPLPSESVAQSTTTVTKSGSGEEGGVEGVERSTEETTVTDGSVRDGSTPQEVEAVDPLSTTIELSTVDGQPDGGDSQPTTQSKESFYVGSIIALKFGSRLIGSEGSVELSETDDYNWELIKKGDHYEIKSTTSGTYLGASVTKGNVFLSEESTQWDIEFNQDQTVSFSFQSLWLSARDKFNVKALSKAVRQKSEYFLLKQ